MCTEKIYNRFMKNALGSIAILGSGETSPNLVSVHRELLEILDNSSDAYMIDTPFGFQENANQLVEKIIEFYKVSLNIEMKLASYRKIEELNTKSFFKSIQLLENASFIFAGPGSPSYASKLWHVEVVGYVSSIGQQKLENIDLEEIGLIKKLVDESEVSCPDKEVSELMINEILTARKKKDTLGGSITLVAKNFPAGCGSYVHFDRKLDAKLTSSMMSVQSVKAVEVGSGIEASKDFGTAVQDQIVLNEQNIERITNNLGGFEGGMSTGEPIMITSYLKPISTTLTPIKSVDLASQKETETNYERSDTCAVPRAVPIFESVISIDLLNSLIENTGGDNKELILKRVNEIKDITLDSFNLANKTWSMKYENE